MFHFGFDLDNTLIDYSQSCFIYARENNLKNVKTLNELRLKLKPTTDESVAWTRAQSWIYGEGLSYARISEYAVELLGKLKAEGWQLSVFSHKSNFGPAQFGSVPLVNHMLNWIAMSDLSKFFTYNENLFFYASLDLKISGINLANLHSYVDDLPKVFSHPNYPKKIRSFLYKSNAIDLPWVTPVTNFSEIDLD